MRCQWKIAAALIMAAAEGASAAMVMPDDMAEARRCAASVFDGQASQAAPVLGLDVTANYDLVQKNGRFGKPLRLGRTAYRSGLFCHANSRIVVRLGGPGRRFEATVGVDTNEQTSGGRGSVVFAVQVGGRDAFRSHVIHEGEAPVPVKVDLAGASEFVLEVTDGGDGITCDQSDWADARITMADGRTVRLSDLPMAGGPTVADAERPVFAFSLDGADFAALVKTWRVTRSTRKLDDARAEHTVTYVSPDGGLTARLVGVAYADFPTIEWTVYLKNTGAADSPMIDGLQALDMRFERGHYGEFLLHHATGSPCSQTDYAPAESPLAPSSETRFGGTGGRPSGQHLPYFNLELPTGHGVIVVVGWPGQWSASWARDGGTGLRVRAGQELTHFRLYPGEEVRTPLIALQFWCGEWIRSQNVWRRWMLAHNVPKPGGKLPEPELFGCSSHLFSEMEKADEANQKACIDRYLEERIPIGHWWMDAGWYPNAPVGWPKTGTWEVDATRFPNGLRAISDHAHAKDIRTILWFEPERVHPGTWLTQYHPEWILGGAGGGLLNLGNPDARAWLTDHVDRLMTDQGIDLYRQDFNMEPLTYWRSADASDRQGITEIRHVEGYLAYWDELLRRHPGMFIDTCASGGNRNDLETLRRAIPLWRTDWRDEPIGTQSCTYGISLWMPLSGTGTADVDTYLFRSNMAPFTNCLYDIRDRKQDYDLLRKLVAQWRQVAPCYVGDFYPLTSYSVGKDTWMAWQFDRPDTGEGMVQAFRREKCIFESGRLKLQGLDPKARYSVRDLDKGRARTYAGSELMEKGILVSIDGTPGAKLLRYQRVK